MAISFALEFGTEEIPIELPDGTDILRLPADPPLGSPREEVASALAKPIFGPSLAELAAKKRRSVSDPVAAIVVSDNTRPVPYKGEAGILAPILAVLREGGIAKIKILIANGTHRSLTPAELENLLPPEAFERGVEIINHVCTDGDMLREIGTTARGTRVTVNRHYLDADLKILTGLVEPHFMAGASGGPKSICPGLVGLSVTEVFHGPRLMADAASKSLLIEGNPCQEEARAVAEMAGTDFIVNVTINREKKVSGVFAGGLEQAHAAAVAKLGESARIDIPEPYDCVITHAGFAGINHYQAAKAAVEGVKALRKNGTMILLANHTDVHPVGGEDYRRALELRAKLGTEDFREEILKPDWIFIPEQWEVQMWLRVFERLGSEDRLVYCSPQLTGDIFRHCFIPGRDGGEGLSGMSGSGLARAMLQKAIDETKRRLPGRMALLADGPYAVPQLDQDTK